MARSLDDIFTTAQNIATGLYNLATAWQRVAGTATSSTVDDSADVLVVSGTGRFVNISVIDGGSASGIIYNSASTTSLPDAARLAIVPLVEGVYPINVLYTAGLVISPGTGQILNITYSPDRS